MATDQSVIIGIILGLLFVVIICSFSICLCQQYKRFKRKQNQTNFSPKSSIRSISTFNDDFHKNQTLLVPSRRLAILEFQQTNQDYFYDNSSFDNNETIMRF